MFDAEKVTELIADLRAYAEKLDRAIHLVHPGAQLVERAADALEALSSLRDAAEDAEIEWEYAHRYTGMDGRHDYDKVDAEEYAAHRPDGRMADGTPYWNYRQFRRVKAGPWLPVPEGNQ